MPMSGTCLYESQQLYDCLVKPEIYGINITPIHHLHFILEKLQCCQPTSKLDKEKQGSLHLGISLEVLLRIQSLKTNKQTTSKNTKPENKDAISQSIM